MSFFHDVNSDSFAHRSFEVSARQHLEDLLQHLGGQRAVDAPICHCGLPLFTPAFLEILLYSEELTFDPL